MGCWSTNHRSEVFLIDDHICPTAMNASSTAAPTQLIHNSAPAERSYHLWVPYHFKGLGMTQNHILHQKNDEIFNTCWNSWVFQCPMRLQEGNTQNDQLADALVTPLWVKKNPVPLLKIAPWPYPLTYRIFEVLAWCLVPHPHKKRSVAKRSRSQFSRHHKNSGQCPQKSPK